MLGFIQIILFCLPIALGASLSNGVIKVEEVGNSEGWPWQVMQRPTKEGASVIYDRYNGVYVKDENAGAIQARESCWGANIGGVCCIGIYCSDTPKTSEAVRPLGIRHEQFSSEVDPNRVKKVVLHSDGTTDIDYVDTGNVDAVCVGIRVKSCCVGLCCGCLDVIGNGTSTLPSGLSEHAV
ncbi:hypothetical protein MG1_01241 [Candida albicans GC75]|nr:hypothetical protein MG1_01241 [Candida albicans GC75]KHC48395.1 hypothetical protein W5O_01248 [Candida albicans Ca6]KHC74913.1 hypothetical protein MGI_00744 [Candida albicans P75016]